MKKLSVFVAFLIPLFCIAQVSDTFLHGNFINNPIWTGSSGNFYVNSNLQLQSKATSASTSFLFTPSEAIENASWETWVKIAYNPSSSNYASVYIISDRDDITTGCNGYYVQVGGTNDEVSLFLQVGTSKTKIIDGVDKRTDTNPVEIKVKVTRDIDGNFMLYSKLPTDANYVLEGSTKNTVVTSSAFFGLLFANTSTTGSAYYFDDVLVTGNKAIDITAPVWNLLDIKQPNKLILQFSERMNFAPATFSLDNEMGNPVSTEISTDKTSITLVFASNFEKGKIYNLQIAGLVDLSGNELVTNTKSIGISEKTDYGDIVINEVMFENAENSVEYIELFNTSNKLLDISGFVFTTRKTDGSLNTGNKIPPKTNLLPHSYLALCSDAVLLRKYHSVPLESSIISTDWSTLNNESASILVTNSTKDSIWDELKYDVKWHHPLVKNPKGVGLERINPALPTQNSTSWHSASSDTNYGTPGYLNSQFRDLENSTKSNQKVWPEPESFSPDNDGIDDVCFIRYKTEKNGYVANVAILNAVGVKIYQLASNILLSSEGFLTWDGRTSNGKNANVGIYILYFEMFNPETGDRKQYKMPIVVSSR